MIVRGRGFLAVSMLAREPEKVVMAHGRPYDRDDTEELRHAFRWLGSK